LKNRRGTTHVEKPEIVKKEKEKEKKEKKKRYNQSWSLAMRVPHP
jgi:hypothetical protein